MWNRNFLLLWQGLLVSHAGTQLFNLALLYWVLETTGSATLMGLVLMAAALPGALFGPFAGALADRYDRKRLIIGADAVRGLAGIVLAAAVISGDVTLAITALFVCQMISGLCGALFAPAVNAMLPDMVAAEHLPRAISVLQGTNALISTASYGVGGFLYALFGAPWLFLVNALSFLASAASESFISTNRRVAQEAANWRALWSRITRDAMEGMRYVWSNPGLRVLLSLLGAINFVIVPTGIALPILVKDYLDRGPEFLGIMGAFQAAGGLLGFLATGTLSVAPSWRGRVVGISMLLAGLTVVSLGFVRHPVVLLATVSLFGFLLPMINVNIISLLQGTTPAKIRGRVMGVMATLVLGLIPIAQGLSGLVIDAVDQQVALIYTSVGMAFIALVLLAFASQRFRAFLGTDYSNKNHAA